ncbi:auxin-responsive protein SAUR71 [Lactuca sativa]|uniref:auxin-responsive protein SAUR71 n=1 Tax=Lactuca sativa TaxID=4236 RepID=UPI000CBC9725|nr:auxin-responsive protein SAUR71 [Lactuca sativa]
MLGKKIGFVKRLGNKIKIRTCTSHGSEPLHYECLLSSDHGDNKQEHQSSVSTPRGCIALYVGEERRRFVVHTAHLSHPLFQILLEKTAEEFGFVQKDKLVIPCTIDVFREVVRAVKCNNGKFDLRYLVEEINYSAT